MKHRASSLTLLIMSSACFKSSNNVSPTAVLSTGTRAGNVDSSKSFLSYINFQGINSINPIEKLTHDYERKSIQSHLKMWLEECI